MQVQYTAELVDLGMLHRYDYSIEIVIINQSVLLLKLGNQLQKFIPLFKLYAKLSLNIFNLIKHP